jgi:hypothetical protein
LTQKYDLEKWIWTDADFEQMGWHDCPIYALAFPRETYDLALDIDYIFKWVHPVPPERNFSFWMAPATLVFENANEVIFKFDEYNGMEIDSIEREKAIANKETTYIHRDEEWLWTVSCHRGDIEFRATGFKQYIRSEPKLVNGFGLEPQERGGYSFTRGRDSVRETLT